MCTFAMSVGRNPLTQESILFKSQFVNSPKFKTKDRSNQCSFCVYAGSVRSAHCPRIYNGVGILFLHSSFGQGVWRCLQIDGRKATSLTSFLFLSTLLIATIRRLAWRKIVTFNLYLFFMVH